MTIHMNSDRDLRNKILVWNPKKQKWVKGRGFSIGELNAVSIDIKKAIGLGLPIDKRRKSTHNKNIEILRTFFGQKPEEQHKPVKEEKAVTTRTKADLDDRVLSVVDTIVKAVESANRRKREKILAEFLSAIRNNLPELSSKNEEELAIILEELLKDLEATGLGKLGKTFFIKSKEWDSSIAVEILSVKLKKIVGE